jgi:type I restriction enzyme S subunit
MGIVPQLETAAKTDDGDNRKLVRVGDFAINSRSDRRGSCGISAYDGSVSLINLVLTPRGQMYPRFYNWLFHTELFADEFYKWGHGIVDDLWTTRWQEMKRISIVSPSYQEQQRIAEFLDRKCAEVDEMIALQEQIIEELKAYKQSVITEAVTKGLNPAAPMRDSGIEWIGSIPEHWEVCKLKRKYRLLHLQFCP